MAVFMGEITTHEIRFHEDRNKVLRALGGENAKAEVSEEVEVAEGRDAFLLCTDGFWEYVYEPEMEDLLQKAKDPQDWLKQMEKILLSRVSGENDNYTAAAVFC
jgi:serine/threonine protein phosphatase PrpC